MNKKEAFELSYISWSGILLPPTAVKLLHLGGLYYEYYYNISKLFTKKSKHVCSLINDSVNIRTSTVPALSRLLSIGETKYETVFARQRVSESFSSDPHRHNTVPQFRKKHTWN